MSKRKNASNFLEGSVVLGYVHPNIVTEGFARSLAEACLWRDNNIIGIISSSSPRQHVARNATIEKFLEGQGEYLMWIDTDMTFEHHAIQDLRRTLLAYKADMAAGLAFIYKRQSQEIVPNAFQWSEELGHYEDVTDYRSGHIYEVTGTGSAFVLIHRRVLEATGPEWHQNWMHHPSHGGPMGHDLAFFWEACVNQGYRLVYDTNVQTGHIKHFELNEHTFRSYQEALQDDE